MTRRDETAVERNDWSVLVPGAEARWSPSRTVSICIPTRNPGRGLTRTLHCLSAQTYPSEMMEVVIADDGSDAPIVVPDGLPFEVTVVRHERKLDFGAGAARNLAGSAAAGEVLFFLDADVIPERQVVESYARWFDACDLAVPMGLCRFVDVDDLDDDALVDLVASASMASHFEGSDVDDQSWRERHFGRLDDLKIEALDAFRVTIGATLAVSAAQFEVVGGFPELGVRGVEDTAFGYRVHNNGGVLILDRDATHWHQGRRNLSTSRRQQIDEVRAPYVQSVIPVRGFRRGEPPEQPPVTPSPILRFHARGDGPQAEEVRRLVDEVGSGNVQFDDEPLEQAMLHYDDAFAHVVLPVGVDWSSDAVPRVIDLFVTHDVGVIRAVVDDEKQSVIDIARTRALRRAARMRPTDDLLSAASDLFGVWWIDAGSILDDAEKSRDADASESVEPAEQRRRNWLRWRWWTRPRGLGLRFYRRLRAVLRRAAR